MRRGRRTSAVCRWGGCAAFFFVGALWIVSEFRIITVARVGPAGHVVGQISSGTLRCMAVSARDPARRPEWELDLSSPEGGFWYFTVRRWWFHIEALGTAGRMA